jgi:hypothetical protein
MLALLSAWAGLAAMVLALAMLVRRGLFGDVLLTITLYAGALALTLGGIALWALRKESRTDPGVRAQQTQCYIGCACALVGIAIVYGLIAHAQVVPRELSIPLTLAGVGHDASFKRAATAGEKGFMRAERRVPVRTGPPPSDCSSVRAAEVQPPWAVTSAACDTGRRR